MYRLHTESHGILQASEPVSTGWSHCPHDEGGQGQTMHPLTHHASLQTPQLHLHPSCWAAPATESAPLPVLLLLLHRGSLAGCSSSTSTTWQRTPATW